MRTIFLGLLFLVLFVPLAAWGGDRHHGGRGDDDPSPVFGGATSTSVSSGGARIDEDEAASSAFAPWSGKCASIGGAGQAMGAGASFGTGNVLCDQEIIQASITNYIRSVHDVRSACEELTITKRGISNLFGDSEACGLMRDGLELQWLQIEKMIAVVDNKITPAGGFCDRWLNWFKPFRLVCGN